MNHAQLLHKDTLALVSCRHKSRVVLYDVAKNRPVFSTGEGGTASVIDEHGQVHDAGAAYWSGQHNAEWYGDDTFWPVWKPTTGSDRTDTP